MTIQEAIKILKEDSAFRAYQIRRLAEHFPTYQEETKDIDEKLRKIAAKIIKLQEELKKLSAEKDAVLDRLVDAEMQKYYSKVEQAKEILKTADEMIAERMANSENGGHEE